MLKSWRAICNTWQCRRSWGCSCTP